MPLARGKGSKLGFPKGKEAQVKKTKAQLVPQVGPKGKVTMPKAR